MAFSRGIYFSAELVILEEGIAVVAQLLKGDCGIKR